MKKYFLAQLFLFLVPFLAFAQDIVIKGTKPVDKKYTPQEVIDSLQKTFPNAESVKYFKANAAVTQKGWAVTKEDELMSNSGVDYYTISFDQEGLKYYGLYDEHGNLLEYKVQQKMDKLPDNVVASLKSMSKDYPGYKVVSKDFYMTKNYSKSKDYYQITASNGKQKKEFFYSPEGELLKVK